jgi:glucose/arabinose dehydrogenase
MIRYIQAFLIIFLFVSTTPTFAQTPIQSQQATFVINEITQGLEHPWGLAFLPNGDMLVTERTGYLRRLRNGKLDPTPISGLPKIFIGGQGGLLDVAIHPNFRRNRLVYLSYSARGRGGAGTHVARGRLVGNQLKNVKVIFKASPKTTGRAHYGSRLLFGPDGTLYITTGDRYHMMEEAQNPRTHLGSIVRINDDGSIPKDNPFVNSKHHKPETFTYGHRNAQGIALRPLDNSIWSHEHGPRGGDEVNKLEAGNNYGWPTITYGVDYSGAIISDKTHAPGMEQPIVYWDPSIAPCGMTFYNGDKFPEWRGDLFVGALAKRHLRRLELRGDKVISQEVLLEGLGRIRDVRSGPDGYLYVLTDSRNGQILRLEPANDQRRVPR